MSSFRFVLLGKGVLAGVVEVLAGVVVRGLVGEDEENDTYNE